MSSFADSIATAVRRIAAPEGLERIVSIGKSSPGTAEIHVRLKNPGKMPVALGKIMVFEAAPPETFGAATHDTVVLGLADHAHGQGIRRVHSIRDEKEPRIGAVHMQFFDRSGRRALQIGFLSFDRVRTCVSYSITQDGALETLRAWCDFEGWRLAPGAEIEMETFYAAFGTNPFEQLETWASLAAERMKIRLPLPPAIGVGASAWSPSDGEVFQNLAAACRKLSRYGLKYLWLSIFNLPGGNPGDWLNWNEKNLPGGIGTFVNNCRKLGINPGLWCAPFYVSSHLKSMIREYDDAMLRMSDGSYMIARDRWDHGDAADLPAAERPVIYALDPSHPKTLAFLHRVFSYYRKQGIRYFMLDFLEAGAGSLARVRADSHADPSKIRGPQSLRDALRVIREEVGEETYLVGCSGPTIHCAGLTDAVRTGNDFGEGRRIAPDSFFYPASFQLNAMSAWTGAATALNNAGASYYTHGKLYWNDCGNLLSLDKPIPLEHARIHAAIHAFSGSSSIFGDDFRIIDADRLRLLRQTLPRPDKNAVPLDLFDSDRPTVFAYDANDFRVVAVYNLSPSTVRKKLNYKGKFVLWDFFDSRYLGVFTDTVEVELPPETVRIYRMTAAADRPGVLGTDLSMLCGLVDLEVGSEVENRIDLTATRPRGESGSVFLYAPHGWCVVNIHECCIGLDQNDQSIIVRVPFRFGASGRGEKRIQFARIAAADDDSRSGDARFA